MNFEVGNDLNGIDSHGTSKVSSTETSFYAISQVFGEPTNIYNNADMHVEWAIEFTVADEAHYATKGDTKIIKASIYDWRSNMNPMDQPNDEFLFNIGGNDYEAAFYVHKLLGSE